MNLTDRLIDFAERGLVPDALLRAGIRKLLKKRLADVSIGNCESQQNSLSQMIQQFSSGPIAPLPEKANEQHYEVGADVFRYTLGQRFKYSCCYFDSPTQNLDAAEEASLQITCDRAEICDGMSILEMGCGWGSLTLWMCEKFPRAKVTAVSNSASQREHILKLAQSNRIDANLQVITCDMNDFEAPEKYDRVVSVEMFEHMRNYRKLLNRIDSWLNPDGKLFVHIFCNRDFTYEFKDRGSEDWMSRYFFSGGVMPGDDLLLRFQEDLHLQQQWRWNGKHYQQTADAWIANMDRNKEKLLEVMACEYSKREAIRWFNRWRIFYMACSELFGYQNGEQWWVSHYLFGKSNCVASNEAQCDSEVSVG